jgi:aquaporin PIP
VQGAPTALATPSASRRRGSSVSGAGGKDGAGGKRARRTSTVGNTTEGFTNFRAFASAGWQRELFAARFRQAVLAEFVATALFVASGTIAVVFSAPFPDAPNGAAAVNVGSLGLGTFGVGSLDLIIS